MPPVPLGFEPPKKLVDSLGRSYSYLRLSVTDRCDLRCIYCMPQSGEQEHGAQRELLDFEEIEQLVRLLSTRGIRRVRLTGGEPLIRRDLAGLIARLTAVDGIDEVVMTTNATRLRSHAESLVASGLRGVNISLDSLRTDRFARLTRGGDLAAVLDGIEAAKEQGLTVKLNTVVMRDHNDDELESLVHFAWQRGITPRFIELMPLGEGAQAGVTVSSEETESRIAHLLDAQPAPPQLHRGPARYRLAADGSGRQVGFVSAVSRNFCGACNRLRVTAKGELRACLASRTALSFRDIMRSGGGEHEILWALVHALSIKADGHFFNDPAATEHAHVGMSLIGG